MTDRKRQLLWHGAFLSFGFASVAVAMITAVALLLVGYRRQ
jgi:hypothetical protein